MPTNAEVRNVLLETRDLMNTNGRHWLKGDMELYVDDDVLEGLERGTYIGVSPKAEEGDWLFCTWGGLRHICGDLELRVEAMEALVKIISPEKWKSYEEYMDNCFSDWEINLDHASFGGKYPTFADLWDEELETREDILGDIIAVWNDADKRIWEHVKASLEKAAASLKK